MAEFNTNQRTRQSIEAGELTLMDYRLVIERVFEHLENDDVGKAVMACLRLARHNQDYLNAAIFLRELYPDRTQLKRIFAEDTAKLNDEQRTFVWREAGELWLDGRTNEFMGDKSEEQGQRKNVIVFGAGQLDSEVARMERSIDDMTVPPGMAPFDVAAFTDRFVNQKGMLRLHIQNLQTIRERIKARCLNYAISLEKQLDAQENPEAFLQQVQTEVNNYFKVRSEDVYLKLQKAAQLVGSDEAEDHSSLLTVVRRAMAATADYFYPAQSKPVICSDGIERPLGEQQFLNRLDEYLAQQFGSSSSAELMRAESALLSTFFRRLNDVASKGVHAHATADEAKQGLVGLYIFLYNVISRLQRGRN
jgi:hypothetical protein